MRIVQLLHDSRHTYKQIFGKIFRHNNSRAEASFSKNYTYDDVCMRNYLFNFHEILRSIFAINKYFFVTDFFFFLMVIGVKYFHLKSYLGKYGIS